MNLDVVELFAGVGGFRVGLNQISEFDKKSGKAIEKGGWNFVFLLTLISYYLFYYLLFQILFHL